MKQHIRGAETTGSTDCVKTCDPSLLYTRGIALHLFYSRMHRLLNSSNTCEKNCQNKSSLPEERERRLLVDSCRCLSKTEKGAGCKD